MIGRNRSSVTVTEEPQPLGGPLPMPEPFDMPDPLAEAHRVLAEAEAKAQARQAREDAEAAKVRAEAERQAAERQAVLDAETERIRVARENVARIQAEQEAARIARLWEQVTSSPELATLADRAAEAWAVFQSHPNGLPVSVVGSMLLDQVSGGVKVDPELWQVLDPPSGWIADLTLPVAGRDLHFRVTRTDGAAYGVVGSVSLWVSDPSGAPVELFTSADLGRVLHEYGLYRQ